jgi:hypothetical protein
MAKGDDYIEQLWVEVVDVPAKKMWVNQCLSNKTTQADGLFKGVETALKRLTAQGASRDDLEMIGAYIRSDACFSVLVALDDPGLGKGRIAGLHKDFLKSHPRQKSGNRRGEFIQWLWETGDFSDDGKWLRSVKKNEVGAKPFAGLFEALQRLLKKAKSVKDLGQFLGWNRYQATAEALRLLEEAGFQTGDEPVYLHEEFETACPIEDKPQAKAKAGTQQPDATQPLWKIKSAQIAAFSPDSKTLAVAGASSPIRFYDLATGQERLSCEGLRVHIYRIAFSPDGKQVAAGQIRKAVTICDARNGKLIHTLKRSDDEISGLEYADGSLICSSWSNEIVAFDSKTGKTLPSLKVCDVKAMVNGIALLENRTKIAAQVYPIGEGTDNPEGIGIWSLKEWKQVLKIKMPLSGGQDVAVSPDSKTLAVATRKQGVQLYDTKTGGSLGAIKANETMHLLFTPDGRHLIYDLYKEAQICIWNLKAKRIVCVLTPGDRPFSLHLSPNGEYLAATLDRHASVWRLQPLLKQ